MRVVNTKNKQCGLTLIELMIAVVLGLLLVAGTIQVFISVKQTSRVTEAQSRLQENARFALEILTRDVRSAGYSGCRRIADDPHQIRGITVRTIAAAPVPAILGPETTVTGHNAEGAAWSPALPATIAADVIQGTDVISIQRARPCGGALIQNVENPDDTIKVVVPNNCQLKTGEIVMISDCEYAHVFRVSDVDNTVPDKQTVSHELKIDAEDANNSDYFCKDYPSPVPEGFTCAGSDAKLYSFDSEIMNFTAFTYYIGTGKNGNPALWYYNGIDTPSELVEGIEDIQVVYGVDDNNDNILDRYETAKTINDALEWYKVVGAQISILVQTLDTNLTTGNQKVNYNGAELSWADGRLRRVFTTTVAIRNRVQ